jgi:hypothetical protein
MYLFVAGQGQTTPIVLQKDVYLYELRNEIIRQKLMVPDKYSFLHPNFGGNAATNTAHQIITEPQEHIISTKDFRDQKIIIVPHGESLDDIRHALTT